MAIKQIYRTGFLLVILILPLSYLLAQDHGEVSFENFKTENIKRVKGLSANMVNAIIQDKQGCLCNFIKKF